MEANIDFVIGRLNRYREEELRRIEVNTKKRVLVTKDFLGLLCSKPVSDAHFRNHVELGFDVKIDKCYIGKGKRLLDTQESRKKLGSLLSSTSSGFSENPRELKSVSTHEYQSVCTIDKVKSALERVNGESKQKRKVSVLSFSLANEGREEERDTRNEEITSVSSCERCSLYVKVFQEKPRCPTCETVASAAAALKRPKLDLNISLGG